MIFTACIHIKIFHHYGILIILVEFLYSWNLTNLWDSMIKFIISFSLVPTLDECLQLVLVLNGKRVTLNVSLPTYKFLMPTDMLLLLLLLLLILMMRVFTAASDTCYLYEGGHCSESPHPTLPTTPHTNTTLVFNTHIYLPCFHYAKSHCKHLEKQMWYKSWVHNLATF